MLRIRRILSNLFLALKKSQLSRTKKVRFGPNTYFSKNTVFGGNNYLSTASSLVNSEIGFASYIGMESKISNTKIGKYTSIGPYVKCIFGNHPTHTFVSTHPAFFSTRKQSGFTFAKSQLFEEFQQPIESGSPYTIEIGNDCWIGACVTLLDGIKIGDGAIIASGALVNRDVPPYAIYGGVPAKKIKYRFSSEKIVYLEKLKWWNKDFKWIKSNANFFHDIEELTKNITL